MKALPTIDLDELRVAAPCDARWAEMAGDDRVRHCGDCDQNVYRLHDLTRAEIDALVREREGDLCVRFYRRADGTVLTADCPVGLAARVRRRVRSAWSKAVGLFLFAVPAFATGCRSSSTPGLEAECGAEVMGKIGFVLPPPLPPAPRELGPGLHDLQPEEERDATPPRRIERDS